MKQYVLTACVIIFFLNIYNQAYAQFNILNIFTQSPNRTNRIISGEVRGRFLDSEYRRLPNCNIILIKKYQWEDGIIEVIVSLQDDKEAMKEIQACKKKKRDLEKEKLAREIAKKEFQEELSLGNRGRFDQARERTEAYDKKIQKAFKIKGMTSGEIHQIALNRIKREKEETEQRIIEQAFLRYQENIKRGMDDRNAQQISEWTIQEERAKNF